jgi:large subunit ribosomal protein L18
MGSLTPLEARKRRHNRVRSKISGTPERPRLSVFRSLNNISAQIVDDSKRHTLVAVSTLEPDIKVQLEGKTKTAKAEVVGKILGERALAHGINTVVFDRGGFLYHGRVKALADGARGAGLQF